MCLFLSLTPWPCFFIFYFFLHSQANHHIFMNHMVPHIQGKKQLYIYMSLFYDQASQVICFHFTLTLPSTPTRVIEDICVLNTLKRIEKKRYDDTFLFLFYLTTVSSYLKNCNCLSINNIFPGFKLVYGA